MADVGDARPDGEKPGDDARKNRRKNRHPQHHPADREHLCHRADLARPMRGESDLPVMIPENPDAADDDAVAQDDESGEPQRQSPAGRTPIDERQGDHSGEQQRLVGDGIDEGAEFRALVEAPGDPAIDAVGRRGENENPERPPAQRLDRLAGFHRVAVVKRQHRIHRNQADPGDRDFTGEGHASNKAESPALRNPKLPLNKPGRRDRSTVARPGFFSWSRDNLPWCRARCR